MPFPPDNWPFVNGHNEIIYASDFNSIVEAVDDYLGDVGPGGIRGPQGISVRTLPVGETIPSEWPVGTIIMREST